MKLLKPIIALICCSCLSSPAASEEPSAPPAAWTLFADNLFNSFNEICLRNRGSWDAMKQATLASPLNFKPVGDAKGRQQADYMAFPVSVALKRWGTGYACIVESIVEEPISDERIAERLRVEGFGLNDALFKPEKRGLVGAIPVPERFTGAGKFSADVHIRLSKSPLQGTQIVQLAVTN